MTFGYIARIKHIYIHINHFIFVLLLFYDHVMYNIKLVFMVVLALLL